MNFNANVSPYYDDFDSSKNFYRILFNPAAAIQSRELTQIQSMLQNQIGNLSDHLFEKGAMVNPGQIALDILYNYVKVENAYNSVDFDGINYNGRFIYGETTGLVASVVNYVNFENSDPNTLYVKYINSGTNNVTKEFNDNEVLVTLTSLNIASGAGDYAIGETITGATSSTTAEVIFWDNTDNILTVKFLTGVAFTIGENITGSATRAYVSTPDSIYKINTIATSSTGLASSCQIGEGVYYVDKFLANVDQQSIILDKYSAKPTYKVGLTITENIITSDDDSTLLDGAQGTSNFSAPGADRLELKLILTKKLATDIDDENFLELIRVENGVVLKEVRSTDYSVIEETMARRTFSESGDYTVTPFGIDVRNFYDDGSNRGIFAVTDFKYITEAEAKLVSVTKFNIASPGTAYFSVDSWYPTASEASLIIAMKSKLALGMEPGVAFVRGYEVEKISTEYIDIDRSRDTETQNNLPTITEYGSFTKINNVYGLPNVDSFTSVSLRDTVVATGGVVPGSEIGTAKCRAVEYNTGTIGTAGAEYKLFIFDVVMSSGTFVDNVKSITQSGTPNFTSDLVLVSTKGAIEEASKTKLVYDLPFGDISGVADETFIFRKTATGTLNGSGVATFSAPTNSTYNTFANNDYSIAITSGANIGELVDLSGNITLGGSPTGSSITVDIGATYAGMDVEFIGTITKNTGILKTKTLNTTNLNITTPTSTIDLGQTDVYEITGIYDSENGAVNATTGDNNITARYELDTGQRDGFYDVSNIKLKTGRVAPTGRVLVAYTYFTHSSGDYFTVDSYSGQIDYEDIPEYLAGDGSTIRLSDAVDFRPDIDIDGSGSFTKPTLLLPVKPGASFRSDVSYYLPRVDVVYIDYKGVFGTQKGIASLTPNAPASTNEAMPLYELNVNAYTKTTDEVLITEVENKRYTMRDIGDIEKRVENVEYYTSLNLLEQSGNTLTILDGSGNDRFKNGIIVDNFKDHAVGDVYSSEYKCSMDTATGVLRPQFDTKIVDVELNNSGGLVKKGVNYCIPYTHTPIISQLAASGTENVNPYAIFTWEGELKLAPDTDIWKDTKRLPNINISNTRGFNDLRIGLRGSRWNDWQDFWSGRPIPRIRGNTVTARLHDGSRLDSTIRNAIGAWGGTFVVPRTTWRSLGNRVVSSTVIPFIRSRSVVFTATKMKPSTRVYPFFDDIDVSANVSPSSLITDVNGTVSGTFIIPNTDAKRFRVGERVFKLTDAIDSTVSSTTNAERIYTASGMLNSTQQTILATTRPQVVRVRWWDPLAQSFMVDTKSGVFLTKIDLRFKTKDASVPVTLQLRNMVNGTPGQTVLPFSTVSVNPVDVSISNDATAVTTFEFDSPVYIQDGSEYCFVVMADSTKYNLYVGELGGKIIGTNRSISEQPYAGVMFKSQNASTWTPDQTKDITFEMHKAVFNTNTDYTATFDNVTTPVEELELDPITLANGTPNVTVYHPNHGMNTSSFVTIAGVVAGTYSGITDVLLNAVHSIDSVTLDTYTFSTYQDGGDVTQNIPNATSDKELGGITVTATSDIQIDVIQPVVQELVLSDTSSNWSMKTTTSKSIDGSQTPYIIDGSYTPVIANDNHTLRDSKLIASSINQTKTSLAGNKSLTLRGVLNTTNENLTPMFNEERLGAIAISNRVTNVIADGEASYLIRRITLNDGAIGLRTFLTAVRPENSTISVYYKTLSIGDVTPFEDASWSLMTLSPAVTFSNNEMDSREYIFEADGISEFVTFAIKVVLTSTNSSQVPQIFDMRTIALGT